MTDLLRVEDLWVRFPKRGGGMAEAVRGISFSVGRERVGIVGESGSGKSVTGRAILRLVRPPGEATARTIAFDGVDLQALTERQMRHVRGEKISMVMQDPKFSLNPVMTVGEQIQEAYRLHTDAGRGEARDRMFEMLEAVQIRDSGRVARLYPHEVSGGMGQRIMIAMMLAPDPALLIADEPTSALDVTVQMRVLYSGDSGGSRNSRCDGVPGDPRGSLSYGTSFQHSARYPSRHSGQAENGEIFSLCPGCSCR